MDETGATAVAEPVETAEQVAETTPESTSQPQNKQQESKESTSDKADRRANPDAMRKTLKWLRENGGEHSAQAQDIERALGELKSWKTVATNVREAREIKSAVDAIAGTAGTFPEKLAKLAEMQSYTSRMQEVDSLIEAGDPRALGMVLETPEARAGIVKLLPHLMKDLAASNPNEMAAAVKPHVTGFLDSQGLPEAIDAMVAAFNGGKPDDAKGILAKIVAWYKGLGGAGAGEDAKPPEQAAWEKERDSYQQKEFAGGVKSAFDAAMSHAETEIDKELAPELKKYGIPADVASIIRSDVWKRIERERNADPLFKSTIETKVNERTRKIDPSTADFLKSQVDARVKEAVRKEIQLRYGFIKKTPAGTPETKRNVTAAPGGVAISIDYPKTIAKYGGKRGAEDAIMAGKAVNSAGKPIVKAGKIWKLA